MVKNSSASNYEKSIIAGHYVFSLQECKEVFSQARKDLEKKNISFDSYVRNSIKKGIMRYVKHLSLI